MGCAQQAGLHGIGEHPARPALRHLLIQRIDLRQATGEHDHLRIEQVDDAGQATRQALAVTLEGGSGQGFASLGLLQQAQAGEALAAAAFERYCERLARGLASVINLFDPQVIVLAGGLSQIDALYQQVPQRWARWVFSDTVQTRLLRAAHGDASGVRGAAWLWC